MFYYLSSIYLCNLISETGKRNERVRDSERKSILLTELLKKFRYFRRERKKKRFLIRNRKIMARAFQMNPPHNKEYLSPIDLTTKIFQSHLTSIYKIIREKSLSYFLNKSSIKIIYILGFNEKKIVIIPSKMRPHILFQKRSKTNEV